MSAAPLQCFEQNVIDLVQCSTAHNLADYVDLLQSIARLIHQDKHQEARRLGLSPGLLVQIRTNAAKEILEAEGL